MGIITLRENVISGNLGDVRIGYVVSDLEGDSVRLRVEYSVNGVWANGSAEIEVYNSIFESNGYGISDTSSNLIVRGSKILRNSVGVRVSSVSNVSIDSCIFDGYYRFGIRAISYDGRKSPLVVLDSVVSDSRSPVLVNALGVQRDSVITVKFNEAVDFSSIFDVVNREV